MYIFLLKYNNCIKISSIYLLEFCILAGLLYIIYFDPPVVIFSLSFKTKVSVEINYM